MSIVVSKCPDSIRDTLDDVRAELINHLGEQGVKLYYMKYKKDVSKALFDEGFLFTERGVLREYLESFGESTKDMNDEEIELTYKAYIDLAVIEIVKGVRFIGHYVDEDVFIKE